MLNKLFQFSDLKMFANSRPSALNFKKFFFKHYIFFSEFLGQNNFGNKILLLNNLEIYFVFLSIGLPDPVRNCSIDTLNNLNIRIQCIPGTSGGLEQQFQLKVRLVQVGSSVTSDIRLR